MPCQYFTGLLLRMCNYIKFARLNLALESLQDKLPVEIWLFTEMSFQYCYQYLTHERTFHCHQPYFVYQCMETYQLILS